MKKLLLVSALGVSLLAACNTTPPVGNKPMTQSTADGLKLVAPGFISATVNGFRERDQAQQASERARIQAGPGCTFSASGNTTDADKDKVPVSLSAAYTNCALDYLAVYAVKNGSASIADDDDNNPKSGFTTKATNLGVTYYTKNGSALGNPLLGFVNSWDFNLKNVNDNYTVAYKYDATLTTYVKDSSTVDKTFKLGLSANGSYVPTSDGDTDNFNAGTINFAGNITYTNDKNEVFVLNLTYTNLTFDAACKAGPTGGKVRFDDGTNNNFLEAVYTGCNTGTLQFNATAKTNF
jgi:hypothetical protein